MTVRKFAYPLAGLFVALVWFANWLTARYGFIHVAGFGFTAGTIAAGLTFGVRDALHDAGGRWKVLAAIVAGAALSYFVAPSLALASGVAFLLSELADLAVYSPLRERRWMVAVVASNLVGALVDTVVFLGLAFGWSALTGDAVMGQMFGKALMVLPSLVLVRWVRGEGRQGHLDSTNQQVAGEEDRPKIPAHILERRAAAERMRGNR